MEIWKNVVGFEEQYEISNLGNLRSKERFVKHWRGGERKYKSNVKNIRLNDKGYIRCNLKNGGSYQVRDLITKMVADPELKKFFTGKYG